MSDLIVVAGATGHLGGRIAAALVKRGARVRGLVRPGTEGEEFPRFQQMQYMHNMQTGRAKLEPIDNDRYPDIEVTTVAALLQRKRSAG